MAINNINTYEIPYMAYKNEANSVSPAETDQEVLDMIHSSKIGARINDIIVGDIAA